MEDLSWQRTYKKKSKMQNFENFENYVIKYVLIYWIDMKWAFLLCATFGV